LECYGILIHHWIPELIFWYFLLVFLLQWLEGFESILISLRS
jgi:hypothetical protein